jgi:hypothetical protein
VKNFILAVIIGILVSTVHLAGESQFRSPIASRAVDLLAIAAFPGTAVAQILAQVTGSMHGFSSSLVFVLVISIVVNTAFYWVLIVGVVKLAHLKTS